MTHTTEAIYQNVDVSFHVTSTAAKRVIWAFKKKNTFSSPLMPGYPRQNLSEAGCSY
jgi:hypothetical protein